MLRPIRAEYLPGAVATEEAHLDALLNPLDALHLVGCVAVSGVVLFEFLMGPGLLHVVSR